MKNNTPPTSDSAAPLSLKLTLIAGGLLVIVMLVFTARSIIGVLRPSSSPSGTMQTNMEIVAVHPKPPEGIPLSSPSDNFGAQISPLSAPDNLQTAAFPASQPTLFTGPNEIAEQRKQARIASLDALQRKLESDAPIEIREQREKQRKAIIEAAKQELLEQAGTSGVSKEALQKLENPNPILF